MKKELGKWMMDAALFVTTVLVFQVLNDAVTLLNGPVAVLLAIATAAALLAAGLILTGSGDDNDNDGGNAAAKATAGRTNAVRAGVRHSRKAKAARRTAATYTSTKKNTKR